MLRATEAQEGASYLARAREDFLEEATPECEGMFSNFFFLSVLGFEFRAFHLLGRCSTA
jgi:hypothetical protein